ncbi:hypothetical protein HMPREF3215_02331 [Staphylococcus simulans]|nr:hypothetical protein HMPREF3215_02331 [Staphylococcus simulans]
MVTYYLKSNSTSFMTVSCVVVPKIDELLKLKGALLLCAQPKV